MIYLDYAANMPVNPAVLSRFCEVEANFPGNPNADHTAGRESARLLSETTDKIASLLGVKPSEIIYTSGASEANNLAIKGLARSSRHRGRHIISTGLEHPSVSGPLTYLQEQGWEIDLCDIGRDGKIDLDHLKELLRDDTVLVAVSAVDSELGTVQPIREIAELLKQYPNCLLHVDATQAIGKIPFSFDGIDTVSFTAHKFGGLNGSGILVKRDDLILEPLIHGGTSTSLYRSGTPTLALAAAMETALDGALDELASHIDAVRAMNEKLRTALSAYPKVKINSPADAVPHILNLSVQGVKGEDFSKALDQYGVCVSVKSACSVRGTPSRAVFAVSRDRKNALSSWRVSLSHLTTAEEIDGFLAAFDACYKELAK